MSREARSTFPPKVPGVSTIRSITPCYISATLPPGAIAEAFGRFPEWTPAIFSGGPSLPGSVRAIARYRLADDAPVRNLDDPGSW